MVGRERDRSSAYIRKPEPRGDQSVDVVNPNNVIDIDGYGCRGRQVSIGWRTRRCRVVVAHSENNDPLLLAKYCLNFFSYFHELL